MGGDLSSLPFFLSYNEGGESMYGEIVLTGIMIAVLVLFAIAYISDEEI